MTILLYSDIGTSPISVENVFRYFRRFHQKDNIVLIDADYLANKDWEFSCKLLIIPGGRDIPYVEKWDKLSIYYRVQSYIKSGGKYLGICAGAYFASSIIDFDIGIVESRILNERKLSLFNGRAVGPLNNEYCYLSNKYAKALKIKDTNDNLLPFYVYYNGGCFFEFSDKCDNIVILAKYADYGNRAAMIRGTYGNGHYLLSGFHFEFEKANTSRDINDALDENFESRNDFIGSIIDDFLAIPNDSHFFRFKTKYNIDQEIIEL